MIINGIPLRTSTSLFKKLENWRRPNRIAPLFFCTSHCCSCKPLLQCHFLVSGPLMLFIEILSLYFWNSSKFSFRYCCIIMVFQREFIPSSAWQMTDPEYFAHYKKAFLCLLSVALLTPALSALWDLCSASVECKSNLDG